MILETTLKNENVTYSRALRGMTVQEIEAAVRATVLDGHDENDVTLTDEAGKTTVLWAMREFMQGGTVDAEVERVTGEVARRVIDMYARM